MLLHVTRRHLAEEMRAWGVTNATAQEVVDRMLSHLGPALVEAAQQLDVADELLQRTLVQPRRLASDAAK